LVALVTGVACVAVGLVFVIGPVTTIHDTGVGTAIGVGAIGLFLVGMGLVFLLGAGRVAVIVSDAGVVRVAYWRRREYPMPTVIGFSVEDTKVSGRFELVLRRVENEDVVCHPGRLRKCEEHAESLNGALARHRCSVVLCWTRRSSDTAEARWSWLPGGACAGEEEGELGDEFEVVETLDAVALDESE
jgi:hypothetical protein